MHALSCALAALVLGLWGDSGRAADKVDLENLLPQMTDLSLLSEYPDPPFVTKQFSSYDRGSEAPGKESWFANGDRGFMLYDGVLGDETPYFKSSPQQGRAADGHFAAGTRVGIAPTHRRVGGYVWAYATAADGRPRRQNVRQGYIAQSAIAMDPQGHVLAEMDGPGCVVRIWSANPKDAGKVRIYLDGAEKPVIEALAGSVARRQMEDDDRRQRDNSLPGPARLRAVARFQPVFSDRLRPALQDHDRPARHLLSRRLPHVSRRGPKSRRLRWKRLTKFAAESSRRRGRCCGCRSIAHASVGRQRHHQWTGTTTSSRAKSFRINLTVRWRSSDLSAEVADGDKAIGARPARPGESWCSW